MYTIQHDGKPFYDPRIAEYTLSKPTLTLEANKHGTLSFTIFPLHPEYGALKKVVSRLSVYRDNTLICKVRPVDTRKTFKGGIEYRCEEVTAMLNDFMLRPGEYNMKSGELIRHILSYYNSRAESENRIQPGNILYKPSEDVEYKVDSYTGCWDALKAAIISNLDGYLVPRYEGNSLYLDYLGEDDLPESSQKIMFGENLTDLFIETNSEETFSILIPTGADYDSTDAAGKSVKKQITIESVNNGLDYLKSQTGYSICGWREFHKRWEDIDDAQTLKETAQKYLNEEAIKFSESVELSAIDLHNANADVAAFRFMTLVTAESSVHDLTGKYVLSRIAIPLGSPQSSPITLGKKTRSLTDRIVTDTAAAASAASNVQYAVSEIQEQSAEAIQTVQVLSRIISTNENAALRIGKAVRDGITMDAIIVNPNWIFKVGQYDVEQTFDNIV